MHDEELARLRCVPVSWSEADAELASVLAIVPPDQVVDRVVALRRAAGLATPVLPHVTVKAQPNLDASGAWRPALRAALAEMASFDLTVGPVGWFGGGIVYLAVSHEVLGVHRAVLSAVEAVAEGERFEYEGDAFVPHLTVGADFAGDTPEQLRHIADTAAWESCRFRVTEVVEFHRRGQGAKYRPLASFPLGRS